MVVADIAEALTADRPYRGPMPLEKVLDIMGGDAPHAIDGDVFAQLPAVLEEWMAPPLALAA
jgi:HD-GYP domain-containing protein (c-di-GMP phosphodiesterase class II)